ncbi:MAG: hypothetical protein EBX50_22970, partial [Chitinophagia bacterium]|nr:hypothetical protein [Chitinophagia bacterium]
MTQKIQEFKNINRPWVTLAPDRILVPLNAILPSLIPQNEKYVVDPNTAIPTTPSIYFDSGKKIKTEEKKAKEKILRIKYLNAPNLFTMDMQTKAPYQKRNALRHAP